MPISSTLRIPVCPDPISAGNGGFCDSRFDGNKFLTQGRNDLIAYEVDGNSGVPFILPGSWVIVDTKRQPINGDVVVALLNDMAYVKVFEQRESHLHLVSPNPEYKPIPVHEFDSFHVVGVVIGCVMRIMHISPIKKDPVYSITEVSPKDGLMHVQFQNRDGDTVDINLTRDEVKRGIRLATQALTRKILKFKGGSSCASLLLGLSSVLPCLAL